MEFSRLKRIRLSHFMTQKEVADKLGISQPNYQRWESGAAQIPNRQLKRLAKALRCTTEEILGKARPFDMLGIDSGADPTRQYFGEVAIHFNSAKHPLLLPISEWERSALYRQTSNVKRSVVVVESLDNRTVLMSRRAITDIYLSSEEFDDYGPEDAEYYGYLGVYPDDEFWRIVEYSDYMEGISGEYDEAFVGEVITALTQMSAEKREDFLARAEKIEWQLPSGDLRDATIDSDDEVAESFNVFGLDDPEVDLGEDEDFFHVNIEGAHRSVFLNVANIEWISVPTHRLKHGALSEAEDLVDGSPAENTRRKARKESVEAEDDLRSMGRD